MCTYIVLYMQDLPARKIANSKTRAEKFARNLWAYVGTLAIFSAFSLEPIPAATCALSCLLATTNGALDSVTCSHDSNASKLRILHCDLALQEATQQLVFSRSPDSFRNNGAIGHLFEHWSRQPKGAVTVCSY